MLKKELKIQIEKKSTEALYAELQTQIGITLSSIERLSVIWGVLEKRGEDLSAYKVGILKFISYLPNRKLAPNALLRLAGNETLLRSVMRFPIAMQDELLAKKLTVVRADKSVRINLEELKSYEIKNVLDFKNNTIFSPSEQSVLIALDKQSQKKRPFELVTLPIPRHIFEIIVMQAKVQKKDPLQLIVEEIVKHYEQ